MNNSKLLTLKKIAFATALSTSVGWSAYAQHDPTVPFQGKLGKPSKKPKKYGQNTHRKHPKTLQMLSGFCSMMWASVR
jgi:hypothetical protein